MNKQETMNEQPFKQLSLLQELYNTPEEIFLIIPQDVDNNAWEESRKLVSKNSRRNCYINLVSKKVFHPWLKEEFENIKVSEEKSDLAIWDLGINGISFILNNGKKIILIADENIDTEEFRIHAEYVDIPSFAADYYLACQIDVDSGFLRVWGYATHKQIKEKEKEAFSDRAPRRGPLRDRSYVLDGNELIQDVNILFVVEEETRSQVKRLPTLSLERSYSLIKHLGNPEIVFPRREISFESWAALIENKIWRKFLYQMRLKLIPDPPPLINDIINLREWLDNIFPKKWQQATHLAIPNQNQSSTEFVKCHRVVDFGNQNLKQEVELSVTLKYREDGKMDVQLLVTPSTHSLSLPSGLELKVEDENGAINTITKRTNQNSFKMNLKSGEPGTEFKVTLTLTEASFTEIFLI